MRTRGGVFTHLSRYDDVSLEPVAARLHFDELCGGSQRGECAVAVRNKTFAGRTGADAAKPPDDAECGGGAAADLPARSSNFTMKSVKVPGLSPSTRLTETFAEPSAERYSATCAPVVRPSSRSSSKSITERNVTVFSPFQIKLDAFTYCSPPGEIASS